MLEKLLKLSVDLISFLQTNLAFLTPIMRFFTFLGNEEFYLLIMPFFVWSVDYMLGLRLGVMLMLSGTFNSYLKVIFHQPRPYWISSEIKNLTQPMDSFGLPSGHSQNAASVFGLLATAARKKWVRITVILIILLIAISRLFLGVHSIADVVLGLSMGFILLWGFKKQERRVVDFFKPRLPFYQILFAFFLSAGMLLLAMVLVNQYQAIPLNNEWLDNFQVAHPQAQFAPYSLDGVITTTGTLFGLVLGAVLLKKYGGYNQACQQKWKHLLRFLIGIAGVLLIWRGLGNVFPRGDDLLSCCLRYIRYALIGLWISGLAPLVFIKTKLAANSGIYN